MVNERPHVALGGGGHEGGDLEHDLHVAILGIERFLSVRVLCKQPPF